MDASVAILLVVAIVWLLLAILYFVRAPPFNKHYLAPDPRDWKVKTEEEQVTSVIDYEPYLYDQPQQPAEQIYRHFIEYYCNKGPTLGDLYDDYLCDPNPLTLWITYGDDPIPTSDQDDTGQIIIPTTLIGARPTMISRSSRLYQRSLFRRAKGSRITKVII
jgi:hypothetical protein